MEGTAKRCQNFVLLVAKILLRWQFEQSGANPTTVSYNAASSLVHFENKNIFFYHEKRSSQLQR
jgi:hypothetical protein